MSGTLLVGQVFILMLVLLPLLAIGAAGAVFRWQRKRQRTSPISAGLLRPAGYSLSQQITDRQLDLAGAFSLAFLSLLMPYALHLQANLDAARAGVEAPSSVPLLLLGLVLLVAAVTYAYRSLKRLGQLRTGLEAETAIGQALETMIARGYRVYHDIPADGFNVDHLAVGPAGVFVFETKGRTKPLRLREGKRRKDYEVTFKEGVLEFPGWQEAEPIRQALAIARWVENWLSRATGKPIEARPVLAIPGWWIERKSRPPPWITNGTKIEQVFSHSPGEPLDAERIEQICYQVEQRVRVKGLATDSADAEGR